VPCQTNSCLLVALNGHLSSIKLIWVAIGLKQNGWKLAVHYCFELELNSLSYFWNVSFWCSLTVTWVSVHIWIQLAKFACRTFSFNCVWVIYGKEGMCLADLVQNSSLATVLCLFVYLPVNDNVLMYDLRSTSWRIKRSLWTFRWAFCGVDWPENSSTIRNACAVSFSAVGVYI